VAAADCNGGLCSPTCSSGWGDCNHPIAPAADDGCETNFNDVGHCGGCSNACNLANATPDCPSGTCVVKSCNAGYFDCDAKSATGCECPGVDFGDGMNGCCASGKCQPVHSNGMGNTFFDCTPIGTYTDTLAFAAAKAYPLPNAEMPFTYSCPSGSGSANTVLLRNTAQTICVAWGYAGSVKGMVTMFSGACKCPTNGSWQ
jgi:hypothetical protein